MEFISRPIAPGVTLRMVHTDKFKSAVLGVTFLPPLDRATAAENAVLPSLLRRGCARYPDMQSLSAALDELYGGAIEPMVRRKGETQCVGFTAGFLDDAYAPGGEPLLERAAALLGDLTLRPATENGVFRADYTAGERSNLIDRIRGQKNDKMMYAVSRLVELMCADERFGVDKLGDEASAAAITPQSLWARYQALLAESEVALYYCGSASPERVEAALSAAFCDLPRGVLTAHQCDVRANAAGQTPRVFTDRLDVTQGKLTLGFRTGGACMGDSRYPALLVFNAAYGGSTNSKLFLNVRERLSLCYYASSMLERLKGVLLVTSGVEFAKFGTAKDEMLAQLEACRQGDLTERELTAARLCVATDLKRLSDSQGQLEDYWLTCAAAGETCPPETLAAQALAVELDDVVQIAQGLELDGVYYMTGKEA